MLYMIFYDRQAPSALGWYVQKKMTWRQRLRLFLHELAPNSVQEFERAQRRQVARVAPLRRAMNLPPPDETSWKSAEMHFCYRIIGDDQFNKLRALDPSQKRQKKISSIAPVSTLF